MSLFNRKPLTPDEKDLVRELYSRSQKNPNLLSQDDAAIVNELYRRLDAEDPVRTALDKSMSGEISDREALEYANKYGYDKPTRKLYKKIKGLGTEPEVETPRRERPKSPEAMNTPSSMNITDVNSVLETEKKKQIIQQAIEEKNTPENIESEFEKTYKINPFEKPVEAFNMWFDIKSQENPIELAEYFENGTLDLENINESFTEALNSGKLDKELGVIRPGDELAKKPELDKSLIQPTSMQAESTTIRTDLKIGPRKRDWWDAMTDKSVSDFVPFYKDVKEAGELGTALKYLSDVKAGKKLTDDEIEWLKEFAEEQAPTDDTTGAKIVDTLQAMVPFAGEIFTTYGIGAILKKGAKATAGKMLSNKVKKDVRDYIEEYAKTATVMATTAKVTEAGLKAAGLVKFGKMDDKIALQKQLPQFDFANDGIVIQEEGMDKATAEKQAAAEAYIEYASEFTGPALKWAFGGTVKQFKKVYKGLSKGQKEVAVSQAVANTAADMIKKQNPAIKITKDGLVKIRQYAQMVGYDGVLEEWGEERVGDATRAFLFKLSESGLIEGFDNEEYVDNVVTQLASGEYRTPAENMFVELAAFAIPAVGAG